MQIASLLAALLGGTALAQNPIEVESLETLDPMQVALPGAEMRGNLWSGTDAELAKAVLATLPSAAEGRYQSDAVAGLATGILTSGGEPPAEGRGDGELAALRVDRLLAAGGVARAFDLLERTPGLTRAPQLARWHAELGFATGNEARACRTADGLIEGRDSAYWLRARAYCLALADNAPAAELTAELARGQAPDDGFDARLFALTLGTELDEDAPAVDSGLEWSMSRHLANEEDGLPPLADDAPAWLAGEVDAMRHPHAQPAEEPMMRMVEAEELDGDERVAALESVLAQGMDRELAGRALGLLLADAAARDDFLATARRYGAEVSSVPVTEETLDYGYHIALAAVLVDDMRSARIWRDALVDGPPRPEPEPVEPVIGPDGKPVMADPALQMAPVPDPVAWEPPSPRRMVALDLAIGVATDRLGTGGFDALLSAWFEAHGDTVLPEALALSRLGAPRVEGLRLALLRSEPHPEPHAAAMEAAARAGARAESALLATALLADSNLSRDADAVSRAVAVLDEAGLREAALVILLERVVARAA